MPEDQAEDQVDGGRKDQGAGLASLRAGSTNSGAVADYYDDWAASYDETLQGWRYSTPDDMAELLRPHITDGAYVLDVGCGTGGMGQALIKLGRPVIDGIDISTVSLELAGRRGVYRRLIAHDLQQPPLPVRTHSYDAASCVGVLTYIAEAETLLADMCRAVRPGGVLGITQRSDLWQDRDFDGVIKCLQDQGLAKPLLVSDPMSYLPGHEDFQDEVKVILCLLAVS